MFRTKHGEPIMKILNAYPSGPVLAMALETYVQTQEELAREKAKDEIPEGICEGLHSGPSRGLVCKACHDAEVGAPYEAQVIAEIEIAKAKNKG